MIYYDRIVVNMCEHKNTIKHGIIRNKKNGTINQRRRCKDCGKTYTAEDITSGFALSIPSSECKHQDVYRYGKIFVKGGLRQRYRCKDCGKYTFEEVIPAKISGDCIHKHKIKIGKAYRKDGFYQKYGCKDCGEIIIGKKVANYEPPTPRPNKDYDEDEVLDPELLTN